MTPAQRHDLLTQLTTQALSPRSACRWSGLSRRTARYRLQPPVRDAEALTAMQPVMTQPPRFGYRRVAVLAQWSFKPAWRLWNQPGFAVQPARVRRPRSVRRDERFPQATQRNHGWTYEIWSDRWAEGWFFKTLRLLDEFTRAGLALQVAPSIRASDVIAVLPRTRQHHAQPPCLRSDHGSEFSAIALQQGWPDPHGGPRFSAPGHPWHHGFFENLHGKFRDECLKREWFPAGHEATIVIEPWRKAYKTQRPQSALGYQTPAQMAALSPQPSGAPLV